MAISGRKIKEKRKEQCLTVKTLSEKSGVDMETIRYWEKKEVLYMPNLNNILKVCAALNCSMQDIVEDNLVLKIRANKGKD